MKIIPATTPTRYLTGACALNIPAPERTSGDWHFQNVFFVSPRPAQIAGDGPDTLVDTNRLFGGYGIHECSTVLRDCGVILPDCIPVYAANHYRAILDLLISSVRDGKPVDYLAQPEDWLDTPENVRQLVSMVERVEPSLPEAERKTIAIWKGRVLQ